MSRRRNAKPPPKDCTDLRAYKQYLYSKKFQFACPRCQRNVSPRHFEKHCKDVHGLDTRLCCAWCSGLAAWSSKCKSDHARHLLLCSQRFCNASLSRRSTCATTPLAGFDRTPLCPARDLFGRTPDPQPRAYDPVWPVPLPSPRLPFDVHSLNLAAACVQLYLTLGSQTEWIHVIVRAVAYASFLRAMDADEGRTRTLPFSCWCDGGHYPETRHRHHRHLIVVTPNTLHFEKNVWKHIKIPRTDRPGPHFRIVHREPIRSPLHLVHAMGYLSQRDSQCEFSGDKVQKANHFFIATSLPRHYRLPLALQWEGGLLELMQQELKHLGWSELVRAPLIHVRHKWRLKVKDVPGVSFGTVLPVHPDFVPCERATDCFLHLLHGKRLHFRKCVFSDDPARFVEQARMAFYDAVGEELWTPRPFHQKLVNVFKPDVDRNLALEAANARLASDPHRIETLERDNARLESEAKAAERENIALRKQNTALHKKIHRLNKVEIARLVRENEALRQETAASRQKSAAVRMENESLQKENERLTRQVETLQKEDLPAEEAPFERKPTEAKRRSLWVRGTQNGK